MAHGDFNNDGYDDVAMGDRFADIDSVIEAGSVRITYGSSSGLTTSGSQLWHQNTPGIAGIAETGDQFGFALAAGDYNGDGVDDLAISAPFEDVNGTVDAGVVHVLFGSSAGLQASGSELWTERDAHGYTFPKAEFGHALAAGNFNGDVNPLTGLPIDDLAIGMPGRGGELGVATGGLSGSFPEAEGAVIVLEGTPAGLGTAGASFWRQDTSGIKGGSEENDDFGQSLTTGDFDADGFDDLAVGVPEEDLSQVGNDGAVNVIYGSAAGLTATDDQIWHQGSSGINGGR